MRRLSATLALPCMLFTAAEANAQTSSAAVVGPVQPAVQAAPRPPLRDRAAPISELPANDRPAGLIGAVPVADNALIGVGRFSIGEIARFRTNTETERNPADVRRRDSRIAGLGLRLRF